MTEQPDFDGSEEQPDLPEPLNHAGMVVERAIEFMIEQHLEPIAIASALLGGALGLLARTMSEQQVLQVLRNAEAAVRAGQLRQVPRPPGGTTPGAAPE